MFWLFWTGICFLASRANNIKIGIYLMLKRLFLKKKKVQLIASSVVLGEKITLLELLCYSVCSVLWKALLLYKRWLLQK